MAEKSYDIAIIGGGPGGYVAAIRAAQLKQKVCVIEREHLGGVCLNWGCIPTKALLHVAEFYETAQQADKFGVSFDGLSFDIGKTVKYSRKVAGRLNQGVKHLMKKNRIDVIEGEAAFKDKGTLTVKTGNGNGDTVKAKNIIIATGARARELDTVKADEDHVWTYKEAMVPEEMPGKLLVIGSGAIGIEFASFYNAMGADVTVVEVLDRIVPAEDPEISKLARKAFEKRGMTIHTGAGVKKIKSAKSGITASLEKKDGKSEDLKIDKIVLAVGITGNVENLGLEDIGVKVAKGHIETDEWGATGVEGVWAIGDVAGPPWLAHKASHEGVACVEKIAGYDGAHPVNTGNIPACTYCHPQIASVGLTEEKAKEDGYDVKVGRFDPAGNGKAIAMNETEGLVKTVFDAKTGELLGAHMIGAGVTELIQGYVTARTLETTEAELMQTIYPHPTLSEMMHEAVLDAYGRVLHL